MGWKKMLSGKDACSSLNTLAAIVGELHLLFVEVKELAQKIAKQIETDLRYPGRIKLTMIRETRIVEYAR